MDVAVFSLLCTTLLFYLPEYRTHICHMTRKTLGPVSTSDAKPYHTMFISFFNIYTFSFFYLFFLFSIFRHYCKCFSPDFCSRHRNALGIYVNSKVKDGKKHKRKLLWIWSMSALIHVFAYFLFTYSHAHFFLLFAVIPWMLFTLLRLKDEKKEEANERLNWKWIASKRINVFNEALECCCCYCCCNHWKASLVMEYFYREISFLYFFHLRMNGNEYEN